VTRGNIDTRISGPFSKSGAVSVAPRRVAMLGAGLLLVAAGALQRTSPAQQGRGTGPQGAPLTPGQNRNGMHIYLWGGLKSHGEGQHDYPQFLADWSKILTERGAVVDGSLHMPRSADLEHTDVDRKSVV